MIDERSEAVGWAVHYASDDARQREVAIGNLAKDSIRWLLEEVVLNYWGDSIPTMVETLEGLGAPSLVLQVARGLVD